MTSWKIEGNSFVLDFKNVEKWVAKGEVTNFEVASPYGTWAKAVCRIDGSKLIISSPAIEVPVQLRYMWKETCEGNLFNEAGLPLGAFRCGKNVGKADIFSSLERSGNLIYQHNMLSRMPFDGSITYQVDNSDKFVGKPVKRIIYTVELTGRDGSDKWMVIAMDAFSADVKKIGVPFWKTGVILHTNVKNLYVSSNAEGIITGFIPEGSIEFWGCDYVRNPRRNLPGTSRGAYDFDDNPIRTNHPGYGSMQIHNFKARQTIFAYNNFRAPASGIGFGNSPGNDTDWTFVKNSGTFAKAILSVYAEF
jgi:sialate O-acetylesterase